MSNDWIKGIGLTLQGKFERDGELTVYHMSTDELEKVKRGEIAVVGTTTYSYSPNGSGRVHDYALVNMDFVKSVDIFYDTEDDYQMSQTFHFKDGSSRFGMSRDHDEVALWESNGVKITKSYGY